MDASVVLRWPRPRRAWLFPVLLAVALGLAAVGTGYSYRPVDPQEPSLAPESGIELAKNASTSKRLQRQAAARNRQLQGRLARTAPRGTYIVVDQTHNRLYLKKDDAVVREAVCSAGSGMVLKEGEAGRKWVFTTTSQLSHSINSQNLRRLNFSTASRSRSLLDVGPRAWSIRS